MRIQSCFKGHPGEQIATPNGRYIITCPHCEVATHQHSNLDSAVHEWNNPHHRIWARYSVNWWTFFYRWWRGNYA
jgi:hypothetical protein